MESEFPGAALWLFCSPWFDLSGNTNICFYNPTVITRPKIYHHIYHFCRLGNKGKIWQVSLTAELSSGGRCGVDLRPCSNAIEKRKKLLVPSDCSEWLGRLALCHHMHRHLHRHYLASCAHLPLSRHCSTHHHLPALNLLNPPADLKGHSKWRRTQIIHLQ
jgi:hypothetical protein